MEVMIAVAIIGLIATGIFRFVASTLQVVQAVGENAGENEELEVLCRVIQQQLNDLPMTEPGSVQGQPHVFGGIAQDELLWHSRPGFGLFTSFGSGDYTVTLRVQTGQGGAGGQKGPALGVRRLRVGANPNDFNWMPLVPGINALEVRYFNRPRNEWEEKWTQPDRPNLIKLKFSRADSSAPYEVVLIGNGRGGRLQ